uniref:Uncharacterized protein n=1 Tax=Rhizobium loti TaxID=381 RepID=Q8KGM5_RHILI|nr:HYPOTHETICAL PROTEIN [Mesorhizobium japonicum R7A]
MAQQKINRLAFLCGQPPLNIAASPAKAVPARLAAATARVGFEKPHAQGGRWFWTRQFFVAVSFWTCISDA